jgi:hypothetical protein
MFMPRRLAHAVEQVARQSVGKDWGLYAALLEHWQDIVGVDYARVTTPVKIVFPHQPNEPRRRGGTLTVRLPKGLAMEFSCKTEQIRQRINGYFGHEAIGKIAFDPVYGVPAREKSRPPADPAALSAFNTDIKSLNNNELQDVLKSFGEAILTSREGMP